MFSKPNDWLEIENKGINKSSVYLIFPNPNRGEFTINLLDTNEKSNKAIIRIINSTGKEVYSCILNESSLDINLKEESSGIYFIEISISDNKYFDKIIINR